MAIPRVFVSSTFYDLKYIRENLKYFIKTLGYDPVLGEDGNVYYDPATDTTESCINEVPSCQMLVLIIGGRSGGDYKGTGASITNNEYREAVKAKIPVFALVDATVLNDYDVFRDNIANKNVDETKITYPAVDDVRIYKFIEEVRTSSVNNALNPFSDFSDIESYLKQQWAGMLFSFLTRQNEDLRVADTLSELTEMSEKIEFLSGQILNSVGTDDAKLTVELYELMLGFPSVKDIMWFSLKPAPKDVIRNKTFKDCVLSLGVGLKIEHDADYNLSGSDHIEYHTFTVDSRDYLKLRKAMVGILASNNITPEQYLKSQEWRK
jgi:hypothetical protein